MLNYDQLTDEEKRAVIRATRHVRLDEIEDIRPATCRGQYLVFVRTCGPGSEGFAAHVDVQQLAPYLFPEA